MLDHKTQIISIAFLISFLGLLGVMSLLDQAKSECTPIQEGFSVIWMMLIMLLTMISLGTIFLLELDTKWAILAMLTPQIGLLIWQGWDVVNCRFDTRPMVIRELRLIDKRIPHSRYGKNQPVCSVPSWHPPQIRLNFPCSYAFYKQHEIGDTIRIHTKPGFLGDEWIFHYE